MDMNKEQALAAKDKALHMIKLRDFITARRFAIKADQMDPSLKLSQLIQICEVHCAALTKIGEKHDWYGILQVERYADDNMVKKQYKKLALILHPDKNKYPGAEEAFKLIGEAHFVLTDATKRLKYDCERWFPSPQQTPTWTPPTWGAERNPWSPTSTSHQDNPRSSTSQRNHSHTSTSHQDNPRSSTSQQNHSHTSTSHEEHIRKKSRFVYQSSSSSDSSSDEKEVPVVDLSDDDVHEEKKTQEEDVADVEEEKKAQEGDVPDLQEEKKTQEEDVEEEKEEKEAHEGERIFYDAPEFSDFDKSREESCFEANQIWALYDAEDGMPRVYALIKVVSPVDFVLHCEWLELAEDEENEDARPDLPVSVGEFEVGSMVEINRLSMFSHLVYIVTGRLTRGKKFTVFPKKGETWALFKNWDSVSPLKYEYDYVEILSARAHKTKVTVGFLSKVEGYASVFRPRSKNESCDIPPEEYFRFSHRVPSLRLTGAEGRGITEGWYELDPAATP